MGKSAKTPPVFKWESGGGKWRRKGEEEEEEEEEKEEEEQEKEKEEMEENCKSYIISPAGAFPLISGGELEGGL